MNDTEEDDDDNQSGEDGDDNDANNNNDIAHLDGGEGGHNGGRAKPVGDHGEVGEVALYAGVQDGLGPGVAEGRLVLIQQVHQLLGNESIKEDGDKLLVVEKHVLNYAKFVQS